MTAALRPRGLGSHQFGMRRLLAWSLALNLYAAFVSYTLEHAAVVHCLAIPAVGASVAWCAARGWRRGAAWDAANVAVGCGASSGALAFATLFVMTSWRTHAGFGRSFVPTLGRAVGSSGLAMIYGLAYGLVASMAVVGVLAVGARFAAWLLAARTKTPSGET